jgi:hypothetical protein
MIKSNTTPLSQYSCKHVIHNEVKKAVSCVTFFTRGRTWERYLLVTYMIFMTFINYENDYSIKIYHLTPRP